MQALLYDEQSQPAFGILLFNIVLGTYLRRIYITRIRKFDKQIQSSTTSTSFEISLSLEY